MKTIAFYNLKGGVGKTTAAVNFSYFAAQEGKQTLLWDLDAQGAATFHFWLPPEANIVPEFQNDGKRDIGRLIKPTEYPYLDIIPANFKIRNLDVILQDIKKGTRVLTRLIQRLVPRYDYLFFDCPASISLLAQSVFRTADYLIMPVIPTTLSEQTFQRIHRYILKRFQGKPQLIPFFSMVDQRKTLHREIITRYKTKGLFCESFIPTRSIIEQMGRYRAPLPIYSLESKATEEYKALWNEVKTRIHE